MQAWQQATWRADVGGAARARDRGPFAPDSPAALVAHLNWEAMAHGAEICLLRDLYRAQRR
ncbi:hypothetical protein [Isoptericola jiangsuensis]|uniref:hypothetical protein n=1 Tax=Isoptericola jiangsuensis TaxID=548579 RepID=UPI001B80CBD9|nr:hypothetical protein [Isoptericola jiangsuensis]